MKIQNSTVSKCKTFVAAVFIIYNIDKNDSLNSPVVLNEGVAHVAPRYQKHTDVIERLSLPVPSRCKKNVTKSSQDDNMDAPVNFFSYTVWN